MKIQDSGDRTSERTNPDGRIRELETRILQIQWLGPGSVFLLVCLIALVAFRSDLTVRQLVVEDDSGKPAIWLRADPSGAIHLTDASGNIGISLSIDSSASTLSLRAPSGALAMFSVRDRGSFVTLRSSSSESPELVLSTSDESTILRMQSRGPNAEEIIVTCRHADDDINEKRCSIE